MDEPTARELALTVAVIINEDILGGTINQTFDKAWEIANKFIIKYPLDTDWEKVRDETDLDFDETIIKFTKNYQNGKAN